MTYRKYASDVVWLIDELFPPRAHNNENADGEGKTAEEEQRIAEAEMLWNEAEQYEKEMGFSVRAIKVNAHPMIEKEGDVDGIYLLSKIPDGTKEFEPQPFIPNSRKDLEDLIDSAQLRKHWNVPKVKEEWDTWQALKAPQSDDSVEHCMDHPLYVPFLNELFSGGEFVVYEETIPLPRFNDICDRPPVYETTNSVQWGNRGHKSTTYLTYFYFLMVISYFYS